MHQALRSEGGFFWLKRYFIHISSRNDTSRTGHRPTIDQQHIEPENVGAILVN